MVPYRSNLPAAHLPDHLGRSVFALVMAGVLGVPALIFSTRVRSLERVGDTQGAIEASEKARRYGNLAIGFGTMNLLLFLLLIL